jgi:thiosulfate/3-mercaptopyruvate sulfurtransferase
MSGYAHPEVLVSTRWVADHLDDPAVRFVEIETTTEAYDSGHVAGAVGWDLYEDLLRPEPDYRIVDRPALEALLSRSGISNDTTVVFYGDRACSPAMAFWLLSVYGHREVRFMNGGRKKWIAEDRPITTASPAVAATTCTLGDPDWSSPAVDRRARQRDRRRAQCQGVPRRDVLALLAARGRRARRAYPRRGPHPLRDGVERRRDLQVL